MVRALYGPVAIATPTADDGDLGPVTVSMDAYRTRTGSTAETDLQTTAGTAIPAVVPNPATGAATFYGPDNYNGMIWLADPSTGLRWPVVPNDIADRIGGVSSVSLNGGTPMTGVVDLNVATDGGLASVAAADITDAGDAGVAVIRAQDVATLRALLGVMANVYWMAVWNGTGSHPVRPPNLPADIFVKWRQPNGPLAGPNYAHAGDGWMAT